MSARYRALVAGASGVVGRRLAEVLAHDPEWEVIGLSRRAPAGTCSFKVRMPNRDGFIVRFPAKI